MSPSIVTTPAIVQAVQQLREQVEVWRKDGHRIGLVPTMGALHDGHLSLVRLAEQNADKVIVSIFVNPTQFAPHEDFDRYPRDLADDTRKLATTKTDLIYAPPAGEMYARDFSTSISVGSIAEGLCSNTRPHFFGGVAVVVAKLLLQCLPDIAVFGEKDYQQLLVIRRMVRDLNIPVEILAGQTCREADGLAISSRNAYLSPDERQTAAALNQCLRKASQDIVSGKTVAETIEWGSAFLQQAGFDRVDYLEIRDAENLQPVEQVTKSARILVAAVLGKTRLIDNMAVEPPKRP